jgi:hypothetical protein
MPDRSTIFAEIENERSYQQDRWGNTVDDTLNTPWMWAAYVCGYATKWMKGTFLPLGRDVTDSFRACMIKTAALCIAAVESIDRQRAANGQTFYEEPAA